MRPDSSPMARLRGWLAGVALGCASVTGAQAHMIGDAGHDAIAARFAWAFGAGRGALAEPDGAAPRVRPVLAVLRGARITAFAGTPGETPATLRYPVNARPASVGFAALGGDGGGGDGKKRAGPPPNRESSPTRDGARDLSAAPEFTPIRTGNFGLRCPAVGEDGVLPIEFTGDGASISPPLEWSGGPADAKAYAIIMHHIDPEGMTKWYWTLYNIPAETRGLPKDARGIGVLGNNSITRRAGYAPPHSKGPGAKTYVLTAYALSAPVSIPVPPNEVNRAVLLAAMKDLILDSAELKVICTRLEGAREEAPAKKKR